MDRLASELKAAKRHQHPFSVCIADLDHFKSVNDTYGHQAGDNVLARFGKIVKASIRSEDTAGRYGGEEFGIVFPFTKPEAARQVLERIRKAMESETFHVEDGRTFRVTVSFGLAQPDPDAWTEGLVIDRADQALYQAKQSGRNRIVDFAG